MSIVYVRFAVRGAPVHERAALLERLLARAAPAHPVGDWRAQALGAIAPELGAVALAVASAAAPCGARDGMSRAWGLLATPVRLVAGMTSVSMPADAVLELEPAEADALVGDFNRVFGGAGVRLVRGRGNFLLCAFDAPLRVATADPELVRGRDLWGFLPSGADGGRIRRLMSEIELWLHPHPVNEVRRARGLPPISGLWLWGEGILGAPLPTVRAWTAGNDPLFTAFDVHSRYPRAAGAGAAAGAGGGASRDAARSGVVVLDEWPGTPAWGRLEREWLAPAVEELRCGALERLDLSGGTRCFSVKRRGARRFWRRARPWWQYFDAEDGLEHASQAPE